MSQNSALVDETFKGSLPHFEEAFAKVGWFIPPYANFGFLSPIAAKILKEGPNSFGQERLETALTALYEPNGLAAKVCNRYPQVPFICDYKEIIAESVEAHFLGLHHAAATSLVPVIEGAGKEIANLRGIKTVCRGPTKIFQDLAKGCMEEALHEQKGAVGELISMLNSFASFTGSVLFLNSCEYIFDDKTNRHGMVHGSYKDKDYGRPLNFYKLVGAVDFLCLVVSLRESISWWAPESTPESIKLASHYNVLLHVSHNKKKVFSTEEHMLQDIHTR